MTRRPTRLEQPLPGSRCPACWLELELKLGTVSICTRCFVLVGCTAPAALRRLDRVDLLRLAPADQMQLTADRHAMVTAAASAWRALPRVSHSPGASGPFPPGRC